MEEDARSKGLWQLPLQTVDLISAFMIWVIISTLLPFIRTDIPLSHDLAAWVVAVPVVLGSILRIPFGYLTGRFGARPIFLASFLVLLFPIAFISFASTPADLLVGGTFLGIAGAVFSVGVTSLPKYFPKDRQGFANGVYGLGNIGTAVTTFGAPLLASAFGWQMAVRAYLGLALVMVLANLILGDRKEKRSTVPVASQLKVVVRDWRLWVLSLFYMITFGSFVAFTVIMPNFLVVAYGFDGVSAGFATGLFIVLAAGFRVLGGWLADRYSTNFLLAIVFTAMAVGALVLTLMPAVWLYYCGLLVLGVFCGIGNGVVFKIVPAAFPEQLGIANGFVAMVGGLGGFFPPLVLSFFLSATGSYASGFLLFACTILVCLAVTLWQVRRKESWQ